MEVVGLVFFVGVIGTLLCSLGGAGLAILAIIGIFLAMAVS